MMKKRIVVFLVLLVLLLSAKYTFDNMHYIRLMNSIESGNIIVFQNELQKVKNVDRPPCSKPYVYISQQYRRTALQEACYRGETDMVTELLKSGADPNYSVEQIAPFSPLMWAILGDVDSNINGSAFLEIGDVLIKNGADVNYQLSEDGAVGVTALYQTVNRSEIFRNEYRWIKLLCDNGANVNELTAYGTIMHAVCAYGEEEMIDFLIENYNVDLNLKQDETEMTCLMYYCRENNNPNIVSKLIAEGATYDLKDTEGKTAYDYAVENQNLLAAEALRNIVSDQ